MYLTRFDFLIFFILFFLSIFLIFFNQNLLASKIHQSVVLAIQPFQILLGHFHNYYEFWLATISDIRKIKFENQDLIQKNLELQSQLTRLANLEEENNLLKNQLNFSRLSEKRLFGANIIGRDYQNSRSFIIDAGQEQGLGAGMTVIAGGGNIIGQVIWVDKNISQVRTIFDIATKISSQASKSRAVGLVRGLGASLIMDLVPKSQELQKDDLVISSGQDRIWPKGLIIGKIASVDSVPNQIFKTARLESLLDWSQLDKVFVILPQ